MTLGLRHIHAKAVVGAALCALAAAGEQSLIVQLVEEGGFTNHAAALGLGQADRIALEEILTHPPDLLLIAGESAGQAHPLFQQVEGMKVGYLDPRLFFCAGTSIPKVRDELARWRIGFEPELTGP